MSYYISIILKINSIIYLMLSIYNYNIKIMKHNNIWYVILGLSSGSLDHFLMNGINKVIYILINIIKIVLALYFRSYIILNIHYPI